MRDILFIGSVLASVTHEMQNVMAIIKESGALTDDVLKINAPMRLRHGDKLPSALANIQEQVARGRDLMFILNSFAHAAADYPCESDLRRFARQISVLAERMVKLKDCTLHVDLEGQPFFVRANALHLMQSVYCGIAAVLEGCESKDSLRVEVLPKDLDKEAASRAVLRISASRSEKIPDTTTLEPVMEKFGGFCRAGVGRLDLNYAAASQNEVREREPAV